MKIIRTIVLAFLLFIGCVIVNGQNPIPNEFAGLCGFCDSLLPMETIENSCAHQSLLYSDNSLWFPNSNDELKNPTNNPVKPSTVSQHQTTGVLKYFKGEAGVLLEMGGIGSEANRNNIINNHGIIGREIATGVYQYLNNGAKPATVIYKCIYY